MRCSHLATPQLRSVPPYVVVSSASRACGDHLDINSTCKYLSQITINPQVPCLQRLSGLVGQCNSVPVHSPSSLALQTHDCVGATTYRLKTNGLTIFLDTWLERPDVLPKVLAIEDVTEADYIFISHAHFDQYEAPLAFPAPIHKRITLTDLSTVFQAPTKLP